MKDADYKNTLIGAIVLFGVAAVAIGVAALWLLYGISVDLDYIKHAMS